MTLVMKSQSRRNGWRIGFIPMSAKAGWGTNIGLAQAAVDARRVGTDPSLLLGGFRDDDKAPGRHSMRYQLIGEIPGGPAAPAGAGECRGVRSNRPSLQVKTATVRSAIGRGKQGDSPWIDGQTDELQSAVSSRGMVVPAGSEASVIAVGPSAAVLAS